MIQTFTPNDLVRHLYTEESPQEADQINYILAKDEKLTENFHELCIIKAAINNSLMEPSEDSVNFILEYSKITG